MNITILYSRVLEVIKKSYFTLKAGIVRSVTTVITISKLLHTYNFNKS